VVQEGAQGPGDACNRELADGLLRNKQKDSHTSKTCGGLSVCFARDHCIGCYRHTGADDEEAEIPDDILPGLQEELPGDVAFLFGDGCASEKYDDEEEDPLAADEGCDEDEVLERPDNGERELMAGALTPVAVPPAGAVTPVEVPPAGADSEDDVPLAVLMDLQPSAASEGLAVFGVASRTFA